MMLTEDEEGSEQAFITSSNQTNAIVKKQDIPELKNVRKQHNKIQKVVETFRQKVNLMIDKQRNDFVQAYENHVYDFHKEISLLRNRVIEIANDKAREEKINDLEIQKNHYRLETMRLDNENNELNRKLKNLTSLIKKLETERDWLLKRLHHSKVIFNKLESERNKIVFSLDNESSLYSLSNNSSLTLELKYPKKNILTPIKNKIDWKDKLFQNSVISRRIPSITSSIESFKVDNKKDKDNNNKNILSIDNKNDNDNVLSQVITKRIVKDEIKELIKYCYNNCNHSVWSRIQKRSINELLNKSDEIIQDSINNNKEINSNDIIDIATELSGYGITYEIILEMLEEKPKFEHINIDSPISNHAII